MKAQAFLNLVSEMMTAQQDYYKARKAGKRDTHNLLVLAKQAENKVLKVIDEGRLEPDESLDTLENLRHPVDPTPAIPILEEHQNGEGATQANLFTEVNNGTTS